MNSTHKVKALDDLSIYARPQSAQPGKTEWVIKMDTINPITEKTEVVIEVISDGFLDLRINPRATESAYEITLEKLAAADIRRTVASHDIVSSTVAYDFLSTTSAAVALRIIDDYSMQLTYHVNGDNMTEQKVILNIEDTDNAGEYRHRLWQMVANP